MIGLKRILLIRTGGTIDSVSKNNGKNGQNKKGAINDSFILDMQSRFKVDVLLDKSLRDKNEQPSFKDSTELDLPDWKALAHSIAYHAREKEVRAVIVTHGTDTMEFTASALAFMLENLNIPVILTGSEIKWDVIESDGPRNLANSFKAATQLGAGVFVLFGTRIMLGCRTIKVHSGSQVGFESPNYPDVADIGGDGDLRVFVDKFTNGKDTVDGKQHLRIFGGFSAPIHVATVVPGTSPEYLYHLNVPGILVSGYGLGNVPERWREVLADLSKKVPVAISTRCLEGGVKPWVYEVGAPETAIPCGDMTSACAYVKLRWAIGRAGGDIDEVKTLMLDNVHDELTLRI